MLVINKYMIIEYSTNTYVFYTKIHMNIKPFYIIYKTVD